MTLISLGSSEKIKQLSSCGRVTDNPSQEHIYRICETEHWFQSPFPLWPTSKCTKEKHLLPLEGRAAEHTDHAVLEMSFVTTGRGREGRHRTKPLLSLGCPKLTGRLRFTWMDSLLRSWSKSSYQASSHGTNTKQRNMVPTLEQLAEWSLF